MSTAIKQRLTRPDERYWSQCVSVRLTRAQWSDIVEALNVAATATATDVSHALRVIGRRMHERTNPPAHERLMACQRALDMACEHDRAQVEALLASARAQMASEDRTDYERAQA